MKFFVRLSESALNCEKKRNVTFDKKKDEKNLSV